MATLEFTVPGKARGKARPRVTKAGHAFTPKETVNAEAFVRSRAVDALAGRPWLEGALRVTIEVLVGVPKSWPKKRRAAALAGKFRPTSPPDIENIAKLIMDSLNTVAYRDDAAVASLTVNKRYAEQPETWVHIVELEARDAAQAVAA